MTDLTLYTAIAISAVAAIAIIATAGLKGFNAWLALERAKIDSHHDSFVPSPMNRIEIADLKERLRKLEAIAAGVDL